MSFAFFAVKKNNPSPGNSDFSLETNPNKNQVVLIKIKLFASRPLRLKNKTVTVKPQFLT